MLQFSHYFSSWRSKEGALRYSEGIISSDNYFAPDNYCQERRDREHSILWCEVSRIHETHKNVCAIYLLKKIIILMISVIVSMCTDIAGSR